VYALDGTRVFDLTTMIAGPLCGTLLADMGADVIKLESLDGDPWRMLGGPFLTVNRGKRAIAVDLRQDKGKEIARKLVVTSDIFLENARFGVWHRLGLDYESLREINPRIIYVSVLGHGSTGPYSTRPGYDPLLQARSGQMIGQGGLDQTPVFHKVALNDYGAPMLAAFGAMLALFNRDRTGEGQHVETSLTNSSAALQAHDLIDHQGFERRIRGGSDLKGLSSTYRLYETAEGWLFVLCRNEEQWHGLCQTLGLESLLSDPRFETPQTRNDSDEVLTDLLSEAFRKKPASEWVTLLEAAGVPCAPQKTINDLVTDPHFLSNELVVDHDHPLFGRVRQAGIGPRLSETPGRIWRTAPLHGQHTDQVLGELGYSTEQIGELRQQRVVA
jgi:crotonobetainyl-CoA:carnitine CoA-transferase CaiB-like acyl-CoA transferase